MVVVYVTPILINRSAREKIKISIRFSVIAIQKPKESIHEEFVLWKG